ncbi:MAG TPA: alkaline phosphatase family protein [Microlunatus sp.]|nr:alkaline phosphatase family protein [Microlunatus sp.]
MTRPHVLFVGIDGVRYDTVRELDTPALDRVAAAGFLQPVRVNAAGPTISGPSWSTMVTGVLPPTHRIFNNELTGHDLGRYPDFITLARRADPDLQHFIGADWEPLVTSRNGGPIFAGGGFLPDRRRGKEATTADWHDGDQQVTDRAADHLAKLDSAAGSVTFAYQLGVDSAGHRHGVGEVYREFVVAADRRLGQLLEAVDSRPDRDREDWLIIVATDHGHLDEGGHGGDSPEERTAWIAACGVEVPVTDGPLLLEQADVAGQVHHVLGLDDHPEAFVGLPFGTRTAPAA